ncbi:hypothetical protein PV08_06976 [Exophiala spinifera]|uniref:Uncharacterized protein n=1 Tax=Exophiala spinifera TaxID=91928 RepID=A0A0D2B670_9EURO|nr:uncharacterized protein PV08_06976 [Exophiala spinifera]KIW14195.1 hypothetical protein PV08_06976 [Exophiala spinifera]
MKQYQVYILEFNRGDPNYAELFVDVFPGEFGHVCKVEGNLAQGLTCQPIGGYVPEDDPSFARKIYVGTVTQADYPRLEEVCVRIPPPEIQFKQYKRISPDTPLRTVRVWVNEVVDELRAQQII